MIGSLHVLGSESTFEQPKLSFLDRTTFQPFGFPAELVSPRYTPESKIVKESAPTTVIQGPA